MYVYSCPINNLMQSYILFDYPELHRPLFAAVYPSCPCRFLSFDRLSLQIRQ